MKREFIINILLLFIINLLVKPLYIFGVEARIQDLVGAQAYGMYFFYFNFVFIFQFINDFGIQNWNAQYVPKNRNKTGIHFALLMQTKGILAMVFMAITMLMAFLLGHDNMLMVAFICVNFFLSSLFMVLRGVVAGYGLYRTDSFLSSLDKLVMIFILGYLVWFSHYKSHFDIMLLLYGQCVSYLLSCMVAITIIFIKIKVEFKVITMLEFVGFLRAGAPFVLIILFMTAYNKLDGVMLGWLLDDNKYQAGVYAATYRFYDAANMVGYLFAALLLPMYASRLDNTDTLKELVNVGFRYTSAVSAVIIFTILFYGDRFLQLLYADYGTQYLLTLRILIVGYYMVSVGYIYGTLLLATGKVRHLNLIFGMGLVLNLILCLILIPLFGAIGAAIVTLLTQTFVMCGQVYLSHSKMNIGILGSELKRIVTYSIAMAAVFGVVHRLSPFEWYGNLLLCILICVLLSFIFKIIDKQDITMLLNKK
jgi:O-antigen/teichoic acid export membrane protein